MILPAGDALSPAVVAPLTPCGEPVAFWWDEAALHVGERVFSWSEQQVVPTNGATFKVNLGVVDGVSCELRGGLDLAAPRVRMGAFGAIGDSDFSNEVCIAASRDEQLRVHFHASGATPDYINDIQRLSLKAGETQTAVLSGHGSSSGYTSITISDAQGRSLYETDGHYRAPGLTHDYQYLWTEPAQQRLNVLTSVWDREPAELEVLAKDYQTGAPTGWRKTATVPSAWDQKITTTLGVEDLPPGFYVFRLTYRDAAGKVLRTDSARYYKPDGKAPWEGTQLGNEDSVPPPWTSPTFASDGTFTCWNRTVKLGGKGLVASIRSGTEELLAQPLTLRLNGRALSFRVAGVTARKSSAVYRLKADRAPVEVEVFCEFDGYMAFTVRYSGAVKSLEWQVDIRRACVQFFDDCSGDGAKDSVGPGAALARNFDPRQKSWWWVTGPVGMMGGVLGLRGTHIQDYATAGHVQTTDDAVRIVTKIVDSPFKAAEPRQARFYLEPTPVKPKNQAFASMLGEQLRLWTGYMGNFYEVKYPGFENLKAFARFRKELDAGMRVFYYNGTKGVSPESPFWGWYGNDWNMRGISYWAHEVPLFGKKRETNNWAYGCPNGRNFRDWKIWGVNWMLNEAEPKMKDLYFDLADASHLCVNGVHGCAWQDDFGRTLYDDSMEGGREIHKRCYRLVKAKNADGCMYGHFNGQRTPSDVFFDVMATGESLCWKMYVNGGNYYDLFTPEMMHSLFMPKAREMTLFIDGRQFMRSLHCYQSAEASRAYDCMLPENQRAIRHFLAYCRIHDLAVDYVHKNEMGGIYPKVESAIRSLGDARQYCAYGHPQPTVVLSAPGPRQLWATYTTADEAILILLNDTDAKVTQSVVFQGPASVGYELTDNRQFDFESGNCAITLGPREAVFIRFKR